MANDYRELDVWQMSMTLCENVYTLIQSFPSEERFALCDQLRRAVISIPSNIAEGNGRDSKAEYARFLSIARGSLFEVQTIFFVLLSLVPIKRITAFAFGLMEEMPPSKGFVIVGRFLNLPTFILLKKCLM